MRFVKALFLLPLLPFLFVCAVFSDLFDWLYGKMGDWFS